jgi:cytochrome P450
VHRIDVAAMTGGNQSSLPGTPKEIYAVFTHDGVSEVLRDGKRFSSKGYEKSMGLVMGHSILEMDEPEHTTYRKILQRAFTKKALARWEDEVVKPTVHGCIDAFAGRGRADLVRELTFPFPVTVIARMIGVPEEEHELFHRAAIELISIGIDWETGIAGSKALGELFERLIAERRREPRDDLVSVLLHTEEEGTRMSDALIIAFLRLLAPAGAETTYRSSSNLLFGLLTNPEQLEAVRADRSLIAQATEEGLRWEAPLTSIMRTATEDTVVEGTEIPAGCAVGVQLGAANRDDARYEEPDRFDIFRTPRQHMAFAFGPHRCLGMHLARIETEVVVNAVLDRLRDVRLDPAAEDVHISGLVFRSPSALPVLFEPEAARG